MLVLVVEDDRDLAANVLEYLELGGIECDYAERGNQALKLIEDNLTASIEERYDVIVMDVQLPGIDGLTICREIRKNNIFTPVLILTAKYLLSDKLEGFSCGADDYLVKPFELPELEARIKVLSKRRAQKPHGVITTQIGDLVVNETEHTIMRGNKTINLTRACWTILIELVKNSPHIVSKERLEFILWPDKPANPESLKAHLYSLRKAIDGEFEEKLIHTLRNVGVRIKKD